MAWWRYAFYRVPFKFVFNCFYVILLFLKLVLSILTHIEIVVHFAFLSVLPSVHLDCSAFILLHCLPEFAASA